MMNCIESIRAILLRDSGELTDDQIQILSGHLATCAECAAFASDLSLAHQLIQDQRDIPTGPSPAVLEVIRKAADRQAASVYWTASPLWKVALAAAAGLAICLTGVRILPPAGVSQQAMAGIPCIATEILPLVALVMDDHDAMLDTYSGESDIGIVADQMLILQGVKAELQDDEITEPTSPEDTPPTVLRWNSSSGSQSETYG